MITITLFHISSVAAAVICLLVGWGIYFHSRRFGDELRLRRTIVAIVFSILAIQRLSTLTIVRPEGLEVVATQPISVLSISFIVLAMGGTAVMGRHHYRNFALWVLMLFIPLTLLLVNALMIISGFYRPLFDYDELFLFRHTTPIIFYGRVLFMTFLLMFWLLAGGMLLEAWFYDRRRQAERPMHEDIERHRGEVRFVMGWALLIALSLVQLCIPSLTPPIALNVIYIAALLLTIYGYRQLVRFLRARDEGRLAQVIITRRVPILLSMECSGTTEWGVKLMSNPFFNGNPMLDDVARALGVKSNDVSAYVLHKQTTFLAWVSDQRLRRSAELIAETDRKIAEIATALGYSDLPTFSRAFKRQFAISPSEYRRKNGGGLTVKDK